MWLKKYWPTLLAAALQAESLWKFLKWALDWRGRYDALAATYHEIGGVGAVIGYIVDPPPWFYPLAFVVGFILIWWNFRRSREQANAEISPSRDMATASDTTPRGAKLITLGQFIIIGSAIVAIIGILIGATLIFIGDRQNAAQHNKAVNSLVEAAKKVVEVFTPTFKPDVITEQERVFVPPELTPERLFSFYQNNTAIQAAELVKPHIGHWMKVIGTLGNVRPWTGHFSQVTFERSSTPVLERTWLDYTTIYMLFRDAPKIDRLKILKRGDKITVIGQIREVDAVDLHLDNCELAA
jgi:hypothetical protein